MAPLSVRLMQRTPKQLANRKTTNLQIVFPLNDNICNISDCLLVSLFPSHLIIVAKNRLQYFLITN